MLLSTVALLPLLAAMALAPPSACAQSARAASVRAEGGNMVLQPVDVTNGHVQAPALRVQRNSSSPRADIFADAAGDVHITAAASGARVWLNGRDVAAEVDQLRSQLSTVYRLLSATQRVETGLSFEMRTTKLPLPPTNGSTGGMFIGGVEAADGRIFCVPRAANHVLVIDPFTGNLENMFEGRIADGGSGKWGAGVRVPDGRLFFLPSWETSVLIIDPATNTMDTTSIAGLSDAAAKWFGAALGHNGIVVGIPLRTVGVIFIDPVTMEVDTTSITASDLGGTGWQSASTADNGLVFGCPRSATTILVVNPETRTFGTLPIPGDLTGGDKFTGSAYSSGRVFCTPYTSEVVLVVNTLTNVTTTIPITTNPEFSFKYAGPGAATPAGHVFMSPFNSADIALVDARSNTLNDSAIISNSLGLGTTQNKFFGGVYAARSTGLVYMIPYNADFVQIVHP